MISISYKNGPAWHATGKEVAVRPLGEQEMKRTLRPALVALAVLACAVSTATATSRIKDLANIEGIRQNQLIGYGLFVGLKFGRVESPDAVPDAYATRLEGEAMSA